MFYGYGILSWVAIIFVIIIIITIVFIEHL
jgi:hypothetical protein